MTLNINHQNNVPEHVAEELDRLGNSDEGIAMGDDWQYTEEPVRGGLHIGPPEPAPMGADRSQVVEGTMRCLNCDTLDAEIGRLHDLVAANLADAEAREARVKELARQLEQVEAERDRYREALKANWQDAEWIVKQVRGAQTAVRQTAKEIVTRSVAALHPKERDDG